MSEAKKSMRKSNEKTSEMKKVQQSKPKNLDENLDCHESLVVLEASFSELEELWDEANIEPPRELFAATLMCMGLRSPEDMRRKRRQTFFAQIAGIAAALLVVLSMSLLARSVHVATGHLHLAEIPVEEWKQILQLEQDINFDNSLHALDDLLSDPSQGLALLDQSADVKGLQEELDAYNNEIDRF
jgi:hypothetical protein